MSYPKKSEALIPVLPVAEVGANLIANSATASFSSLLVSKEFGLDVVLWAIVKIIVQKITAAVVRWINSGFHGAPAFVSHPESFFLNIGDEVAGEFVRRNPDLNFLCSPFSLNVRLALTNQYSDPFANRVSCTLSSVLNNIEGFTDDFGSGNWIAWHTMTQNSANNPIGAYLEAEAEMGLRIQNAKFAEKSKLDWGEGLLSWSDDRGNIQTPGSVIHDQLSNSLGSGYRSLELADEFNEMISALIGQLVNRVLSSGGLRGQGSGAQLDDNGASLRAQYQQVPQPPFRPAQNNFSTTQVPGYDSNGNPITQTIITNTVTGGGTNGDGGVNSFVNNLNSGVAGGGVGAGGWNFETGSGGLGTNPGSGTGSGGPISGVPNPGAISGGTVSNSACTTGIPCVGGTYTAPNGSVYTGGTYTGGTCNGTTCSGGTFTGGYCVSNCSHIVYVTGGTYIGSLGYYIAPNTAIYRGGTHSGGICNGTTCVGGTYSGGVCVGNCNMTGVIGSIAVPLTQGTHVGGTCANSLCTGGTYTSISNIVYRNGTYIDSTCTGGTCTAGTYVGGSCVSNCGATSQPLSGTRSSEGTICVGSDSSVEAWANCSGSLCVGGPGMSINPVTGFWGSWVPTAALPVESCGACSTTTQSCDSSGGVRNCSLTFTQTTDERC